ncbi:hypothetical protein LX66_1896 [Chitinophaga japonensis]|uniref:Uncharacterized protein n=1 Tax=Chitinophaga japonensis TaxID=104662 RepID=A0A562T2D3_CHIJA|nr:hypothetical protein LX66_1896 [Chitinophaga japonensis]
MVSLKQEMMNRKKEQNGIRTKQFVFALRENPWHGQENPEVTFPLMEMAATMQQKQKKTAPKFLASLKAIIRRVAEGRKS